MAAAAMQDHAAVANQAVAVKPQLVAAKHLQESPAGCGNTTDRRTHATNCGGASLEKDSPRLFLVSTDRRDWPAQLAPTAARCKPLFCMKAAGF